MQKKTIKTILLNPPGTKKYFRDYYCSKISKSYYYYHPIDLVYLSGKINKLSKVQVIDAIADNITPEKCIKLIVDFNPTHIIALCSAPSLEEDILFFNKLKELLHNTNIIVTGDIVRDNPINFLKNHLFANAVISNFCQNEILEYIQNKTESKLYNVCYRVNDTIIPQIIKNQTHVYDVEIPLWNKFTAIKYRFPFAKHKIFASILTDYGCPFKCDFCPIGKIDFSLRSINNVIEELKFLESLKIKELYFRDQTFGANNERTRELLLRMISENFNFSWTALSRVDTINNSILPLMKKAGCHTIMLGLESANKDLLNTHNKNIRANITIHEQINEIKKYKINIGGFFMIGFPEEDKKSIQNTIELACNLNLDYASFNIATPRYGTEFRQKTIHNKSLNNILTSAESSEKVIVWNNPKVNPHEILKLKKIAFKKFYLRPKYLIKQILKKRTAWEIYSIFSQFIGIIKKNK